MGRLLLLGFLFLVLPAMASGADTEVKLRDWYFGFQVDWGQRNNYDVFGWDELPTGAIEEVGSGGGFMLGYRFGDRFLLGLQLAFVQHALEGTEDHLGDAEALITGTVLFRQRATLQPFFRGGFGGAFVAMDYGELSDKSISFGTAAIAGGGIQVRLSSRFSLELETVCTFSNLLKVYSDSENRPYPEDTWEVRESNYGWRVGLGMMVWF